MVKRLMIVVLALSVPAGPSAGASVLGEGFERFVRENVTFSGFIENTSGAALGGDHPHFDASNPFVMNRLTVQPEFNVNFGEQLKLFLSWKFVKEPRYEMEAKSRRQTVQPAGTGKPLDNTYYDRYRPVPWEAVLDYTPTDRLALRWGRQFISWGETDGFRLLDVINPQDTQFSPPAAPNLFNLDEARIPSWGLRALYTIRPVTNTILEFFALPGFDDRLDRVDRVMGSNDTADGIVRYGRWSSHPETRMAFGRLFANPLGPVPVVAPIVIRRLPDAGDAWKIGTRITHNFGRLNVGLGHIWGFNPQGGDMVFKVRSVGCIPPATPPLCRIGAAGPFLPTQVNLDLVNDRTHIFAAHFNYPFTDVLGIPVNSTMRGELAFYPDKPYNISKFPGPGGLRAGPHPRHPDGITEKHTIRYALGLDRTALIPFLHPDDPLRAFSLSFQLFQSIILDHEDGIRQFSTAEKIKTVSTLLTLRIGTGYLGDTVLPDVFLGYDPDGYWLANPAVTYAPPWNEKIRIGLIGAFYGGRNKFKSLGLFDEKDSVFLKLRYQF
jgi:hypothetical protein